MALSADALRQMIEQNDEKHEEGHKRLRDSLRDLEEELFKLQGEQAGITQRLIALGTRKTDISDVTFPPRIVVFIVSMVVTVSIGIWGSTAGLRSDVRDVLTNQANATKTADERASQQRSDIEALKRDTQLWKYDVQAQFKELQAQVKELGDRIRAK